MSLMKDYIRIHKAYAASENGGGDSVIAGRYFILYQTQCEYD